MEGWGTPLGWAAMRGRRQIFNIKIKMTFAFFTIHLIARRKKIQNTCQLHINYLLSILIGVITNPSCKVKLLSSYKKCRHLSYHD